MLHRRGNNEVEDEVICYDDQWSISKLFKHSDAMRPLVVTRQYTQISNLALLLLQSTRVNKPTYIFKVHEEATEDSLWEVMKFFLYAMKIAFKLHNNNNKSHLILKYYENMEDLEDFVRKNDKSPMFISLCPAINAAIKIKGMGISNEDYDTIIARARNILKNGAIAKFIFDVRTTHHHKGAEDKYVILVDGFVPIFDEI